MKKMKSGLILLLIFFTAGILNAEEYKMTVQNTKDVRLIMKDFSGKLPVEGYSGNDIIITSTSEKINPPERARGLKAIYPSGSDNTGIGLDIQKNGSVITITCLLPFTRQGDYRIKVPDNLALEFESGCERSNSISIKGMKNEIDINNCHDIDLSDVTGPLVLSTISGNIDIRFSTVNQEKPFSINSISGEIDVTIPLKTPANVKLGTINGGFYSDFEVADTQKDLKRIGGNELNFPLNGGGVKFNIVTISGNIYLRKGN
jgi:lia operon protein LiaG